MSGTARLHTCTALNCTVHNAVGSKQAGKLSRFLQTRNNNFLRYIFLITKHHLYSNLPKHLGNLSELSSPSQTVNYMVLIKSLYKINKTYNKI